MISPTVIGDREPRFGARGGVEWVVGRRGAPEGALAYGWLLVEHGEGGVVVMGRGRERPRATVIQRREV